MPIWIGHRLVEPDDTPPAMTVSAAFVGDADKSEARAKSAIPRQIRAWDCVLNLAAGPSFPPCGEGAGAAFVTQKRQTPRPPTPTLGHKKGPSHAARRCFLGPQAGRGSRGAVPHAIALPTSGGGQTRPLPRLREGR